MTHSSVALLVDGDNISADHAKHILKIAQDIGTVTIARTYGNAQKGPKWLAQPQFHFVHAGTGKNASDLLLTIEAMEFYSDLGPSAFVIASSDGDFTHLARRLREKGRHVVGVGERKTPQSFREASSHFEMLFDETTMFNRMIREVIRAGSTKGNGIDLQALSNGMKRHGKTISAKGHPNWRDYLKSHPDLFELHDCESITHVRFKPEGFAILDDT
ncbi:MAG: NYN domain-containing protein [Silicimonas sp.]